MTCEDIKMACDRTIAGFFSLRDEKTITTLLVESDNEISLPPRVNSPVIIRGRPSGDGNNN